MDLSSWIILIIVAVALLGLFFGDSNTEEDETEECHCEYCAKHYDE